MNGMLDRKIRESLWRSDFEKITDYILAVCELLVDDYKSKGRKLPNNENKIRNIILEEYMRKQRSRLCMSDYRFDLEVPENYDGDGRYVGRVDIRITLKNDFEKDEACYIVECKRIDGTADLNGKYVKDGIARFVTQKYSSYYGRNIMLAFVVKEIDIAKTVKAIEKIQNNSKNPYMHSHFCPVKSTDVAESYQTMHRIETGQLELRHIFADYSSII